MKSDISAWVTENIFTVYSIQVPISSHFTSHFILLLNLLLFIYNVISTRFLFNSSTLYVYDNHSFLFYSKHIWFRRWKISSRKKKTWFMEVKYRHEKGNTRIKHQINMDTIQDILFKNLCLLLLFCLYSMIEIFNIFLSSQNN